MNNPSSEYDDMKIDDLILKFLVNAKTSGLKLQLKNFCRSKIGNS